MKPNFILIFSCLLLITCSDQKTAIIFENQNKSIKMVLDLDNYNTPFYKVIHNDKTIIDTSKLGIIRKDGNFYNRIKNHLR